MNKEAREFQVRMLDWKEIHELPGVWTPERLLALLAGLEVDGVAEDDALEMTLLALQDLEPDEAADRVLEAVFGDLATRSRELDRVPGVIRPAPAWFAPPDPPARAPRRPGSSPSRRPVAARSPRT